MKARPLVQEAEMQTNQSRRVRRKGERKLWIGTGAGPTNITTRDGESSSFPGCSTPAFFLVVSPFRLSTSSDSLCYTLSSSNSVFFVVLLLAPGSRSFFSSLCVLWPPTAPPVLFFLPCPMHQHSSVHFSYPTPSIDPRTSIIIHAHLHSLLSRTYFPIPCFFCHLKFFNVGEGDVLHRLISVSNFVGFPGWTLHRFPSGSVSLFLVPLSLQF